VRLATAKLEIPEQFLVMLLADAVRIDDLAIEVVQHFHFGRRFREETCAPPATAFGYIAITRFAIRFFPPMYEGVPAISGVQQRAFPARDASAKAHTAECGF